MHSGAQARCARPAGGGGQPSAAVRRAPSGARPRATPTGRRPTGPPRSGSSGLPGRGRGLSAGRAKGRGLACGRRPRELTPGNGAAPELRTWRSVAAAAAAAAAHHRLSHAGKWPLRPAPRRPAAPGWRLGRKAAGPDVAPQGLGPRPELWPRCSALRTSPASAALRKIGGERSQASKDRTAGPPAAASPVLPAQTGEPPRRGAEQPRSPERVGAGAPAPCASHLGTPVRPAGLQRGTAGWLLLTDRRVCGGPCFPSLPRLALADFQVSAGRHGMETVLLRVTL